MTAPARLRRNLKLWQVVGISVGVMAPSLAINLEPQGAVGTVGRAIPLTYLLGMIGVLLVSYSFVRLAQQFHHPGAVYGMVGATLGPRTGAVSAWALTGTYTFYSLLTAMAVGIFGSSLLNTWGIWNTPPQWAAYALAATTLLICLYMSIIPARRATGIVLVCEACTVTLISFATVVIFVKLVGHSAPAHQTFTWSVFSPARGTHASQLFVGIVFSFLSFAGFEAAATLGGEAESPRRAIPRALLATAVIIGVFYVAVAGAETMGFGTSAKGLAAFGNSSSLVGDLASSFLSPWVGDLITLGTVISGFSCTLACIVGGSRMIYTLGRDATSGISPLERLSTRWNTPYIAAIAVVVMAFAAEAIFGWGLGAKPIEVFDWTSTIGTLVLLVAYLLVVLGSARFLFFSGKAKVPAYEIVVPILGMAILGYTIFKNIHPTGLPIWEPVTGGAWLLLAIIAVVAVPGMGRRLGERLMADEGMAPHAVTEIPVAVQPVTV